MSTATGAFTAYGHEVEINTLGIEMQATAYFAADEAFDRDVVGRSGWLDRARVAIVDHDGLLYISHYDDAF